MLLHSQRFGTETTVTMYAAYTVWPNTAKIGASPFELPGQLGQRRIDIEAGGPELESRFRERRSLLSKCADP